MNWCKFFGMILNNWQAVVSVWHWEWGLWCSHSQSSLGQHSVTSPGHWQLLSHRRLNDKCSCWFILQCLIKLDLFLVYRNNEILIIHFDWSFIKGFPTLKESSLNCISVANLLDDDGSVKVFSPGEVIQEFQAKW